jgi:multisubunit Na+/H+ antiporter MnhE subunit
MSDDTPTVRFPQSPGTGVPTPETAATSILGIPGGTATGATTGTPPSTGPGAFQRPPTRQRPRRPSRGPAVLFVILAVLVVAAIVVLVVILDGRLYTQGEVSPSSSPTTPSSAAASSSAPAPVKTVTPPAPVAAPPAGTFTSLQVPPMQGGCGRHGAPTVEVSWATSNAKSVWIQAGTVDAAGGGGTELPLTGNQHDVPGTVTVDCSQRSNTFSITLVGDDGAHLSKSWTFRVGGHRF